MLAIFLVLHSLLVPQLVGARRSLSVLAGLNPWLVALGVLAEAASLLAYAQLARGLFPAAGRPRFLTVLRVQLATLGISHVLPGGGAAAAPVAFRMLRRAGVGSADAGFVLGAQTAGSLAVLNVMLWAALVVSVPIRGANSAYLGVAMAGALAMTGAGMLAFALSRGSARADRIVRGAARRSRVLDPEGVSRFLAALVWRIRWIAGDRPLMLRVAGWAAVQWIADAASLWILLAALGVRLEPDALFIAFGLANASAMIPLTPGGLGVFEAVLTSSLVGFGVPAAVAIIGVLAYRFFAFWLPIPIGALAYVTAPRTGGPVVRAG